MYKSLKIFTLVILVISMCTYITYSVEPGDAASGYDDPPAANVIPEAEPPADTTPASIQEQPNSDEQDEILIQAAAYFSREVDAIVMKRLDSFFKNGGKGVIGIYIKELGSGFEYRYNADKTNPDNPKEGYFNTASTCKLLSAAVMYHMNYCGELDLDTTYTDKITKSRYNLKELLPRMISHSVNDYFNITLRHLGADKINDALVKLGLKHSIVYSEIMPAQYSSINNNIERYGISRSPRTTPEDLGYILDLLYAESTLGSENSRSLMQALLDNIYSNRLPAGIDYKSPVAHKTGTSSGEGVYNDAGIILLDGNPYIMVVMSKGSGSNVQSLFRTITGEVYEYIKKRTDIQSNIPQ